MDAYVLGLVIGGAVMLFVFVSYFVWAYAVAKMCHVPYDFVWKFWKR